MPASLGHKNVHLFTVGSSTSLADYPQTSVHVLLGCGESPLVTIIMTICIAMLLVDFRSHGNWMTCHTSQGEMTSTITSLGPLSVGCATAAEKMHVLLAFTVANYREAQDMLCILS